MMTFNSLYNAPNRFLPLLAPLLGLAMRLWVGWVFFKSGLVKIQSFSSTVSLFEYEYAVPLLPPAVAAVIGTAAELILPVLLVLGVLQRWPALLLFGFNIVAVLSYPDISPAGVDQHITWGLILGSLCVYGSGAWTLDRLLKRG